MHLSPSINPCPCFHGYRWGLGTSWMDRNTHTMDQSALYYQDMCRCVSCTSCHQITRNFAYSRRSVLVMTTSSSCPDCLGWQVMLINNVCNKQRGLQALPTVTTQPSTPYMHCACRRHTHRAYSMTRCSCGYYLLLYGLGERLPP